MVDDNQIKHTRIEEAAKCNKGSKMVVTTQLGKSKSPTHLEVERNWTIMSMVEDTIATPNPQALVVTIPRAPPSTNVHSQ